MFPDLCFVLLAISVAASHESFYILASVHSVQCIENGFPIRHQVEEIGINTSAVFSWKIGVDGAEPCISHHRFNHHFAQDPFKRGPFIFVVAVAKQPVPHIKPDKVYKLMQSPADRALFAVQIKGIIAVFFQKTRLNGVHAQIAAQVIQQASAIYAEGL